MLPAAAQMFALVRDLSARREVTEIPMAPWFVQRHALGPLTALAGVRTLRPDLAASTARWLGLTQLVPRLVARLAATGATCAPIKGVSYAAHLYENPAARPMTDVDLLVEPGRERLAREVLAAEGFSLAVDIPMHHASTWVRGTLVVDLHKNILGTGRSKIALDEVWARTSSGWPEGARRLDPVDELIFHLSHMARNRLCGPLVYVVDASRLLEHADPSAVHERARAWGIEPAVRVAFDFCQVVLRGESSSPWLMPRDRDVLYAAQPSIARKLVFDSATAGSARQLAARAVGAGFQWFARRTEAMVAR